MEYSGKLYGKIGKSYLPLVMESTDIDDLKEALRLAQKVINSVKCEPYMDGNKYFLMVPTYKKTSQEFFDFINSREQSKLQEK